MKTYFWTVLTSSEYTQLQNGLNNILNADIAAGNVLTTQHNLLLKINSDADISANGQSLCKKKKIKSCFHYY